MSTKKHCDSCDRELDWIHEFDYSTHSPTIGASINNGEHLELCGYCFRSIEYFLRRIKKEKTQ